LRTDPPITSSIKAIAFYLPQFHPIPENDEWWGKGFTEWNNVVRGRPQFHGHYQPHLPGELGFYDLRVPDIQRRQIELARMYGIHGFCYHHYWFGGRRLLRRPLDQLLADSSLDFPFCLCWANENWTRRWDGHEEDVLMAQRHSPDDDLAFIEDIAPALRDPRYIRIGGRPLLIVYRPSLLPDARQTAELWRSYCRRAGLGEPFLISTHAFDQRNPRDLGFDAATEFAPNNLGCPAVTSSVSGVNPQYRGVVYDYEYLVARSRAYEPPADYEIFRCVAPTWDNEARRPNHGKVFVNSSPDRYAEWLENACTYTAAELRRDRPFVFINAWNEWAEGAHLEPDRRYGYAYLQATASVLQKFPKPDRPSLPAPIPVGAQVD
jgi:lipopolysaccharide biosynthesis protein